MSEQGGRPIRVGLIGAGQRRGWAAVAHLPALEALAAFQTVAVASTRIDGAREVAERWGVAKAFDDPTRLITDPDVEAVVVCVKTPEHAPLVGAAIAEGKHVFCEWPLGVSLDEARRLTDLAETSGARHIVGMQAYESPGARFVSTLLDERAIGDVTSASLVVLSPYVGGRSISPDLAYTADRSTGTNVLTTSAGHALAALSRVVGDLTQVSALVETVYPEVTVTGTGVTLPSDSPNEIAVIGRTAGGMPVTIAVHGGTPVGTPRFTMHVVGTDGVLVVRPATASDSINVGEWIVTVATGDGSARELPVADDNAIALPPGPAKNTARMYEAWAAAIRSGVAAEMDFRRALQFHAVLDAVERSAASGRTELVQAQGPSWRNALE